jgi:hypothetical protein
MTTASCPLATALWGARFAGVWLPSCYTTWGDTTNRLTSDLFDSPRYIRNVETAYVAMHQRYKGGLQPDHIYIEDNRA